MTHLLNTLKYDIEKNITSVLETMINIFNNEFNTAISKVCSIYEDGRNIDSKKYITEMINQMKLESYKEVEVLLNKKKEKIQSEEIIKNDLKEKYFKIKECLSRCGNSVIELSNKKEIEKLFFSLLNTKKNNNKIIEMGE